MGHSRQAKGCVKVGVHSGWGIVGGTVDEVKCVNGRGVDGMWGAETYVRRSKDE